jgi:hypothetical protein
VPLFYRLDKRITTITSDYFSCKCVMNIVVQKICDPYNFFWDVCIV